MIISTRIEEIRLDTTLTAENAPEKEIGSGLASESLHWYDRDGNPAYTVKGKNGADRPATLRDARKYNLVPSVSAIINIESKPQLERWKIQQAYLACLTLPRIDGEDLESFMQRASKDANMQVELAVMRGNQIHEDLDTYLDGGKIHESSMAYVVPVVDWLDRNFGRVKWSVRRSFAHPLGYGGKLDLVSEEEGIVIDFKTKDFGFDELTKKFAYDGHAMQVYAYAHGINMPDARKLNVFISRTTPGAVTAHEWTKADDYQWDIFRHLLRVWQLRKKYDTRVK